jgi:hypothetical protein
MDPKQKEFLFGLAFVIGGIGLLIRGFAHLSTWRGLGRLGSGRLGYAESLDEARDRTSGVIQKVTPYRVGGIKERVQLIAGLAKKDRLKPEIREAAAAVLSRTKNGEWEVPPKDWRAEVKALFEASTSPKSKYGVRYTMDPLGVDLYTAPSKTMKLKIEDCDGQVAYLASLLGSVGYDPHLITMATPRSPNGDFSHILLAVPKPNQATDGSTMETGNEFVIVDPSMAEKGFGWEPPGLADAIRNGRPAGIVTKAKVYRIL